MRRYFFITLFIMFSTAASLTAKTAGQYYELRIYHYISDTQRAMITNYLQHAFIPAMNKMGIKPIGVFEEINPADSTDKKLYVLVPYSSLQQFVSVSAHLQQDANFLKNADAYWNAPYNHPAYVRMEIILLKSFKDMPLLKVPELKNPKTERVYELRSYESAGERLGLSKINMFNDGGETKIFKRIKANAVFYAQVLSGSHMPNLMYLTTYENMPSRDAHWKAFGNDTTWKKISAEEKYQHNVSKIDDLFLRPLDFSQI